MASEEGAKKLTLHQKLLEVQKSVAYFQKENKNAQQGFNYVSSAQVTGAIREAMDAQGLLLKSEIIGHETQLCGVPTKSSAMHWVGLEMMFTWIDADNPPDREVCLWYAEGLDNSEKASGKAATYGEKYFLLKFFHIPTDQDDPDAWEQKHEPAPAPPAPAPTTDEVGRPLNMRECYKMLLPSFSGDKDNATAAVRVAANALYDTKGDEWQTLEGEKCALLYDNVMENNDPFGKDDTEEATA